MYFFTFVINFEEKVTSCDLIWNCLTDVPNTPTFPPTANWSAISLILAVKSHAVTSLPQPLVSQEPDPLANQMSSLLYHQIRVSDQFFLCCHNNKDTKSGISCIFVFFSSPLQNLNTRKINNINMFSGVIFIWNTISIQHSW